MAAAVCVCVGRVRIAYQQRVQSDYYFDKPGLNIFLSIITCGIFGLYIFYQLMRRDRDHNRRRYEMLDAASTFTCGIYAFWWEYDMMVEGNRHLEANWPWDDTLAGAVQALSPAA